MIIQANCLDKMKEMKDNSIDFIVTDPPYGLNFMGKKWDNETPSIEIWKEALRICKPGSMLAAFGGSRTHNHLMIALEQAGWEIRDVIMWITGQGFPKSHNFGRKLGGIWEGFGTCLKPAYEPIIIAMKPLDGTFAQNAEKWGVAGINIDESRIPTKPRQTHLDGNHTGKNKIFGKFNEGFQGKGSNERWPANIILDEKSAEMLDEMTRDKSRYFFIALKEESDIIDSCNIQEEFTLSGKKTANKNDNQNIDLYGKELMGLFLSDTISIIKMETQSIMIFPILNVLKQAHIGTCTLECERIIKESEILNIESVSIVQNGECLIYFQKEVMEPIKAIVKNVPENAWLNGNATIENIGINITESEEKKLAINTTKNISKKIEKKLMQEEENDITKKRQSRFFYCAKASPKERGKDNKHTTVKPLSLMKYIIKLLSPPGNPICLDPFAGSGTTLIAAKELGIECIGIELEKEYCDIAEMRLTSCV